MVKRLLASVAATGFLAACGATSANNSPSTGTPGAGSTPTAAANVGLGSTSLGMVLTNANGSTLYYFTPEKGSHLVCDTGGCASTWPLATVTGTPIGASGVSGTLAVVTSPGGSSVVTYNGWPLHTYSGDSGPGQTNGQGISGMWFAATPGLTANGAASSGSSSSSTSTTPYGGY